MIFQSLIGSLFNSMRFLSVGPVNTQSLLVASTVTYVMRGTHDLDSEQLKALYLQLAIALTLLKGAIQIVFAVGRLGLIVRYVSTSVIVGFAAGAGVLIAGGQVGNFLGITVKHGSRH